MPNSKKTKATDYANFIFQARVDAPDRGHISNIKEFIEGYLRYRDFEVMRFTMGYHQITIEHSPHIHYHAEIKPHKALGKSPERYYWNKFMKMENNKSMKNSSVNLTKPDKVEDLDPSNNTVEESILKCLRYPLKEGDLIDYNNIEDIQLHMKTAQAEFQFAKERKQQADDKKAQEKLRWNKIVKHLDDNAPSSYEESFSTLLDYLREENPTPSPQTIARWAYNYCYKRRVISNDEIITNELRHYVQKQNRRASSPKVKEPSYWADLRNIGIDPEIEFGGVNLEISEL